MTIEEKIEAFKKEVGKRTLTDEQQRIYNAFVFQRAKPYKFAITDAYNNTIRFVLYTNKRDDGVLHILSKHYKGIGFVTAMEILNFCDVIRKGTVKIEETKISYRLLKADKSYTLIVGLKKNNTGGNVLKSFYSDRKKL